jgi:hypothetical protein
MSLQEGVTHLNSPMSRNDYAVSGGKREKQIRNPLGSFVIEAHATHTNASKT